MRTLAILLAVAYVVGVGVLLPGGAKHRIDHQVSVQLAQARDPSAAVSGEDGKTP